MKLPKMLSLLLAVLFISTTTNFAQTERNKLTTEQKVTIQKNIEEQLTALNLSAEQKAAFETITKKYAEQMMAVRDGGGSKFKKYKKVKAIRKNKNKEMKEVLNAEQYDLYLEKQEEMQEKMRAERSK